LKPLNELPLGRTTVNQHPDELYLEHISWEELEKVKDRKFGIYNNCIR